MDVNKDSTELEKALYRILILEAQISVLDGSACLESQDRGAGPCGICKNCLNDKINRYEKFVPPYRRIPPIYLDRLTQTDLYKRFIETKENGEEVLDKIQQKVNSLFGILSSHDMHLTLEPDDYNMDTYILVIPTHLDVIKSYPLLDQLQRYKISITPPGYGLYITLSFEGENYANKI